MKEWADLNQNRHVPFVVIQLMCLCMNLLRWKQHTRGRGRPYFSVHQLYLPTCAKYVLPSCREGSPYVCLLQIFQVFQPVVLYTGEQCRSPVGLCCWRNRWWHRHQDVLCKVLAEEALELNLQKNDKLANWNMVNGRCDYKETNNTCNGQGLITASKTVIYHL